MLREISNTKISQIPSLFFGKELGFDVYLVLEWILMQLKSVLCILVAKSYNIFTITTMKKIILFFCVFMYSGFINAQEYAPFPEDSLFFESNNADDVLMPLVKLNDLENNLQAVNTIPEWTALSLDWNNGFQTIKLPVYNWLGKTYQEGDKIYFISALGDSIYIDTSISLGESYTIALEDHLLDFGEVAYLHVTFYDFFESEANDSVKEYRFSFLDDLNAPVSFNYDASISLDHHFDTHVFQLSKNNGIVKSPAFYYFPYGKQYSRMAKINEVLDFSTSYAYQVFHRSSGDEIQTEKHFENFFNYESNILEKKVCIQQNYNLSNNAFYTTNEVWRREYKSQNFEPEITHYYQESLKDTLYLDDYGDLNKIVPNGLGVNNNSTGYFYQLNTASFVEEKTVDYGYYELLNDSIHYTNEPGSTSVQSTEYYQIALGGPYKVYSHHNGNGYKKLIYYDVNGQTWGEAYTNAYLLNLDDLENELYLSYDNDILSINKTANFESAAIYDLHGNLICSFDIRELVSGVSVYDMHSGIYIVNLWNSNKRVGFKFMK